jgi:hypothetical protein
VEDVRRTKKNTTQIKLEMLSVPVLVLFTSAAPVRVFEKRSPFLLLTRRLSNRISTKRGPTRQKIVSQRDKQVGAKENFRKGKKHRVER